MSILEMTKKEEKQELKCNKKIDAMWIIAREFFSQEMPRINAHAQTNKERISTGREGLNKWPVVCEVLHFS